MDWTYDDANRMLSETTPAGVISYAYNDANQRTSMTAANRTAVTYTYDTAGRLQTIRQGAETFTYIYDTLSRMRELLRPNAVKSTYAYDTINRLERLTHANGLGHAIEDYQYTYTKDDEIASITSLASTPLLPQAKTATPADKANRIAQVGLSVFNFDDEGQTTTKSDASGTTTYEWDTRGRMTKATLPGGQAVSYTYDAVGRRASRTVGSITTSFLYDGQDAVLDKGSDGSTVDYINGTGIDNKLRQASSTTGYHYFVQDHLGSTVALTDAGGNVVERQQYEAFGQSGGSALTRYGYTGRERDNLTGLIYYRARWYDPQQGRFITEDPIEFKGGANWYAYVGNNPVNLIDPLGLQDGPNNALRNPAPPENWIINGLSNTLSDLLGLDRIADLGWRIGDYRRPTRDRILATGELGVRTAIEAGVISKLAGKACKLVRRSKPAKPPGRGYHNETTSPTPVKPEDAVDKLVKPNKRRKSLIGFPVLRLAST